MFFHQGVKTLNHAFEKKKPFRLTGLEKATDFIAPLEYYFKKDEKKNQKLLIFPSEEDCEAFTKGLNVPYRVLKSFTSFPYEEALSNTKVQTTRMSFLHSLTNNDVSCLYLSYPEALMYQSFSQEELSKHFKTFEFADTFFENPFESLIALGYSPSQFVEYPGQFSDKGGVLDIFPPQSPHPVRVGLFGHEIESLHIFSPENQRSKGEIESFHFGPASECFYTEETVSRLLKPFSRATFESSEVKKQSLKRIREHRPFEGMEFFLSQLGQSPSDSILSYFKPENTEIFIFDQASCKKRFEQKVDEWRLSYEKLPETSLGKSLSPEELYNTEFDLKDFKFKADITSVEITGIDDYSEDSVQDSYEYPTQALDPTFLKLKDSAQNWSNYTEEVQSLLVKWIESYNTIVLFCKGANSLSSAKAYLNNFNLNFRTDEEGPQDNLNSIVLKNSSLKSSTKYLKENLVYLSFESIFGKKERRSKKSAQESYFENLDLIQISDMNVNDLVVHRQHGVGSYKGLQIIDLNGVPSECIEIQYSGKDKLFLPVHSINQIRKYASSTSSRSLDKLGGGSWQKLKSKAQKKLKDIAQELVDLYAQRRLVQRDSIPYQTQESLLFEGQFPHQETDDQLKAIEDIEEDLAKDHPMDRLICGDVGFGKTEVAMRAAFHYLNQGQQVAVLAPTTVLSLQHYQSFTKRYKKWPFEIRAFNRFVSSKQIKDSLNELQIGTADLAVGTHRLLSQDIKFKNLGLLIVDEEQKFGVKQKEKIKKLYQSVDILSLSATPIPRTLNMGFLGVRDLSLINTPPKDRLPVKTFVSHYSPQVIKQAIETELERNGQVFFVHNRVQSIHALYEDLKEMMPDVRIGLGHGQMSEKELESIMIKFFKKEIDVLLSTTIIESGVDVSSANTMIINNAQNFGLSQLYQLRGRVGRSEKRAYCYLLIPQNRDLEKEQKSKLKVLKDNTELGSGLQIAHHDLEIRGAGNLLGEAQSGHAEEMGHELYIELLEEAIAEVKGESLNKKLDPEVNIPLPALIPAQYIKDIKSRLYYYRKINNIEDEGELDSIEDELKDQFGSLPEELVGLFFLTSIKKRLSDLGVEELKAGPKNLSLKLTEKNKVNPDVLLKLIQKEPNKYKLTPDQKLLVNFKVKDWNGLLEKVVELESKLKF